MTSPICRRTRWSPCSDGRPDGTCTRIAIGVGAATEVPLRLAAAEQALVGTRPTPETIRAAVTDALAGITPMADLHASAEYRTNLVRVMAKRALADALMRRGFRLLSGGTDNHLMMVDLRGTEVTGKLAEEALGKARITVNKNAIPNDPEKPFVTSGIRLGSPAMTTRGFGVKEAEQVGNLIADLLDNPEDAATIERVRTQVAELTKRFPVYK